MFNHLASLESVIRSLVATVVLLLIVMLIVGGLGITGPAILTFSIWIGLDCAAAKVAPRKARSRTRCPDACAGSIAATVFIT